MPGVTLTVGLRAELLELLGMVRRSGSPLLALCVDRFQRAIERRSGAAPGPMQLALWEGVTRDAGITESVNRAIRAGFARGSATPDGGEAAAWGRRERSGCSPESSPPEGMFPEPSKAKGANP